MALSLMCACGVSSAQAPAAAPVAGVAEAAPVKMGLALRHRVLNTAADAKAHAVEWLAAAGLADLAPSRVRASGSIFVVDLVRAGNPKLRPNQLILRKQDAYGVLVYPSSQHTGQKVDAAKPAVEAMAGMEGMSGAAGMRNAPRQANPDVPPLVASAADAKRGVDGWLWVNGLGHLKSGQIKDLGGIFVAQVVEVKSGKLRNEALMRKADGFVAFANPLAYGAKSGDNPHWGAQNLPPTPGHAPSGAQAPASAPAAK
jgi:hypothetical protein